MNPAATTTNRILVVDDDVMLIGEYLRCLGKGYEPDNATLTIPDLEKVLFGEDYDKTSAVTFEVESRTQGKAAVEAVKEGVEAGSPFSIVFLDVKMPPGIDGIESAKQIRQIDPNVNIVIVTGSLGAESEDLGKQVPPADKIFFFQKPFHATECRQLAAALCGKWHADLALRHANEELEQRVAERTAALHQLAYFDPVTEMPNRLKLIDHLQFMIDNAEGAEGDTAIVLLDIERFSFLNETMGYESGTELLKAVGNRMKKMLDSREDRYKPVAGRFGADEFACLFPAIPSEDALEELVNAVRKTVEKPFLINGRELFLKASIGVAWHPAHGPDANTVFRCAEAALHRSMRRLECGVTYYRSEMRYSARHKFDMEAELRVAIDSGQITAFFQPQLCLRSGAVAGVEALARWIRPDGTVLAPAEFIPLSEEMGISDVLFEAILRNVCGAVAGWRADGEWNIPVAVNLSAHQLRNDKLVDLIKSILSANEVEQRLINLELTETTLLEDLTIARPLLKDLAKYGVGIHIDDFGTGYSSLSYLAELPVQTLKIDQSFVERMTESTTNARVVQAVIALGKAMGLDVIAEGVETEQQLEMVRNFGCDFVQGFLIARPLPDEEFRNWCESIMVSDTSEHTVPSAPAHAS
ncbi:MAG: EAL domain-containing protein [Woeseia sp.]